MEEDLKKSLLDLHSKIDYQLEETAKNRHLIQLLLRERHSDKLEIIESLVRKRPGQGITVGVIEKQLDCARNWALKLMRKAARINPNMRFILGDKATNMPSRLVWLSEPDLRNFKKIQELVNKQGFASVNNLMQLFAIKRTEAKLLADSFCDENNESHFLCNAEYERLGFENGYKIKPINTT
jgi:hypothetical protein